MSQDVGYSNFFTGSGGTPDSADYWRNLSGGGGLPQTSPGQYFAGGGQQDLLSQLGGIDPMSFAQQLGLQGAGSLISSIGSLIGGKSDIEKLQEEQIRQNIDLQAQSAKDRSNVSGIALGERGQDVLNVNQLTSDFTRSILPQVNQQFEAAGQRAGLDSGVALGAGLDNLLSQLSGMRFNASIQNAMAMNSRDTQLLQLAGSLA